MWRATASSTLTFAEAVEAVQTIVVSSRDAASLPSRGFSAVDLDSLLPRGYQEPKSTSEPLPVPPDISQALPLQLSEGAVYVIRLRGLRSSNSAAFDQYPAFMGPACPGRSFAEMGAGNAIEPPLPPQQLRCLPCEELEVNLTLAVKLG